MAETMGFDDEGTRRAHNEVYAKCLEGMLETVQFAMGEDHAIAAAIDALRRPMGYRYPLQSEDKALLEAAHLVMGVRSDGWVQIMSMLCARVRDYAERDARRVSFPKLETDPAADDEIDRIMVTVSKERYERKMGSPVLGEIHIVFDGPPVSEAGRFVEVETADGEGLSVGEWRQVGGYWHLILNAEVK